MALNDKIMFMEEIKWIDDPAVTTDDLPLMDKDSAIRLSGNSKKTKKIASNLDVDRVQIYRSCTYWKVNSHRDSVQSRKNWKPIEYVDFVKDFEGSLLSGKEMTKKYTARWERLSGMLGLHRAPDGEKRWKNRRRQAQKDWNETHDQTLKKSELDETIEKAAKSDDPIKYLLDIDVYSIGRTRKILDWHQTR